MTQMQGCSCLGDDLGKYVNPNPPTAPTGNVEKTGTPLTTVVGIGVVALAFWYLVLK